ncbi:MAG: glutamine--tRNA ligase [Chloroflexi bacterium]|nr:glutamine--tRNA ligase [Chloroflexota bacterium]|tara:strand:+ start:4893 stop:6560 length:1668 start_codon:yes stop_codon:yes gene_type:complete
MTENLTNTDFIRNQIAEDIKTNKFDQIITRFPPEPNGYLHIGHATSICLNFGIAEDFENAKCNLRFDDTNPTKENLEFVNSIKQDIHWLGFDWQDNEFYASNYFQKLFEFALELIKLDKAYVDDQTSEEIRINRGSLTEPGINSPNRSRSIDENLRLFTDMKNGEFQAGTRVLRAKIDMSSPNINMRDPVMYRIIESTHHQTGDLWKIYPMYDFAHGLSDSIEKVTHSLCTLEYEAHRPLYEWFLKELQTFPSQQIEFGKVSLSHTILSKRNLLKLVDSKKVSGWTDPRMPTISGMRRLGYTPEAIKDFCSRVSITRRENIADIALLEHCVREDLNSKAQRRMAVLRPLKIIIQNFDENSTDWIEAPNHPKNESFGTRKIPFTKEIYIESNDFMENPIPKFFRLSPGNEVRLRYGYIIKCIEVKKDPNSGEVIELICTYDPETRGGNTPDGRKVKGTIHWVSASNHISAEVRLFDRLCSDTNPDISSEESLDHVLNPNSLEIIYSAKLEPELSKSKLEDKFQFERLGFFCIDNEDSTSENLIFNRTATLRDNWSK